ncbi:MAG: S8/S53 family peptidase [Candidatus Rokubacteria bacterium]|nr:S8/S53 family peptidase [Candidatus Rokubacteria bacterium]
MAEPTYIVHGTTSGLRNLAATIDLMVKTSATGPALAPLSATRAILGPVYADAIAATSPLETVEQILRPHGAQWLEPVSPEALARYQSARQPGEIDLGLTPQTRTLVDQRYDWHLRASRLVEAWAHVGGPHAIDWRDIVVGQIDTGYTKHPCFGWPATWTNTANDRNFFHRELGADPATDRWANRDTWSAEDNVMGAFGGHGTRTASVLAGYDVSPAGRAADGGQATEGYFGAAPRVPFVPVRISNSVWINDTTDALGDALAWLVDDVGVKVITISMGATLPAYLPPKARAAIDLAYERGIIVCCAAGNLIRPVVTPARAPRTIAVGGSTPGDRPWTGSSYGRYVDVCAPAWPIWRASTTQLGTFEYGYGDGTSFATPQVAGTAALWLLKHRTALDAAYPQRWMGVAAFLKVLKETVRKPGGWNTNDYGAGCLDADAVLTADLPPVASLLKDDEPHH